MHDHTHTTPVHRLRLALALTLVILAVEIAGGLLSGSLALLSDAGHVFTDVLALGLAWYAALQAGRPANAAKTYGYHRVGILAALINALTLILIVGVIAFEAIQRFRHPQAVTPGYMFAAAAVGIAVNLYIGFGLREAVGENLNIRAAMFHVFGDVAASAGVIVGGAIILLTGWYPVDPILSLFIALLIARGAWDVLRETVDILMESAPRDLEVTDLADDMAREPGIRDVHDLHVWMVAGGMRVLSAHVRVDDGVLSERDALVSNLTRMLHDRYSIGHSTIQLESVSCENPDLFCAMHPHGEHCHCFESAGPSQTPTDEPQADVETEVASRSESITPRPS